jgi:hypothetical protein
MTKMNLYAHDREEMKTTLDEKTRSNERVKISFYYGHPYWLTVGTGVGCTVGCATS